MIVIRPFSNADPPGLVEIWRSHPPLRGLMQPMSVGLLEQHVFSKPYFDRLGLLVAEENGTLIGFAHAAFGPTADYSDLSTSTGTTCLLMTLPHPDQQAIRRALLEHSEAYLLSRGAVELYAGSVWPVTPFYMGLYGGSSLPGVLDADRGAAELYPEANYVPSRVCEIWQRELSRFRSRVDRRSMQIRREYVLEVEQDAPCAQWWTACVLSQSFHVRFQLRAKSSGLPVAAATFWDMEPLASGWGVRAMGLVEIEVVPSLWRRGLGNYLVGESLRQLQSEGVSLVECQTSRDDTPARSLFSSLGFQLVETGTWYRKRHVAATLPIDGESSAAS